MVPQGADGSVAVLISEVRERLGAHSTGVATLSGADVVRLLAPFDPIVWDRRRFALLWGWDYRFEAYTPAPKRVRGYYALPLLWRDAVIGWANLARSGPELSVELGFIERRPGEREFRVQLEAELERMRAFLGAPEPEE